MSSPKARKGKRKGRTRSPRCKTCGAAIRVPEGWDKGSAVRKHYWRKHPEVMQRKGAR